MNEETIYALDDIKAAIRNDPPYTNDLVLFRSVTGLSCGWSLFRLGTNLSWNALMPSGMYVLVFRGKDDKSFLANLPLETAVGFFETDYEAIEWAMDTGNGWIQNFINKIEAESVASRVSAKEIPF